MNPMKVMSLSLIAAAAAAAGLHAQQAAKVPEARARATALARVPGGHVRSEELERESGHLIYSYDIVVPGRSGIEEAHVDANTGKFLGVQHEGAAGETREAREETAGRAESGERRERAVPGEKAETGEHAEAAERGVAPEGGQAALRRGARIAEARARAIAAARVPNGRVRDHELENENGRLIYSFEFVVPGRAGIQEVNVDAHTGKVLAVQHEKN